MATDFFHRQDEARRNTGRLVFFLAAGLLAIIGFTYTLIMLIWAQVGQGGRHLEPAQQPPSFWNLGVFALVAILTTLVVLGASWVRTMQLRSGGGAGVAESMGGRELFPGSADPDERKLLNVVEEMSIASSTPMPRVFLMDDEDGINAFAAGWSPETAVIGVTRGAVARLSRDELQGVIGHEFSHILNGDMRMNIRLMGLVFGLLALTVIGRLLLEIGWYSRVSRDDKKGDPRAALALIGLVLLVMGYVGSVFGQLMQAAISRQREFLADASAVQFTRNPAGLAGALKQIGAASCDIHNPHAKEASHMFFGASGASFFGLLATHPPLEERIRRLDPSWDGTLPPPREWEGASASAQGEHSGAFSAFDGGMTNQVPASEAGHDPLVAAATACALLLDRRDPQARAAQMDAVHDADLAQALAQCAGSVLRVPEDQRLAALEECLPALRTLPEEWRESLLAQVEAILGASPRVGLYEWSVRRILNAVLAAPPLTNHWQSVSDVAQEAALALSILARSGARSASAVEQAFMAGAGSLGLSKDTLLAAEDCRFSGLDTALDQLRQASDPVRRQVMGAAVAVAGGDGRITMLEALLVRAYGVSLEG